MVTSYDGADELVQVEVTVRKQFVITNDWTEEEIRQMVSSDVKQGEGISSIRRFNILERERL